MFLTIAGESFLFEKQFFFKIWVWLSFSSDELAIDAPPEILIKCAYDFLVGLKFLMTLNLGSFLGDCLLSMYCSMNFWEFKWPSGKFQCEGEAFYVMEFDCIILVMLLKFWDLLSWKSSTFFYSALFCSYCWATSKDFFLFCYSYNHQH